MRRALVLAGVLSTMSVSLAAPTKVPLEIWGVSPDESVAIDGVAVNVRTGGAPRVFTGDPDATNAPVLHEVAAGKHEIVVTRAGCLPRTLTVSIESASKRAVVLEPIDSARCAIPHLPPRR